MIENARITDTWLGYEGHGILTAYLTIQGDGWGQSFGGYGLGPGGKHMAVFVNETLKTVGVEKWEDLNGKPIRVDHEINGTMKAIGHIIEDKWFNIKEKLGED